MMRARVCRLKNVSPSGVEGIGEILKQSKPSRSTFPLHTGGQSKMHGDRVRRGHPGKCIREQGVDPLAIDDHTVQRITRLCAPGKDLCCSMKDLHKTPRRNAAIGICVGVKDVIVADSVPAAHILVCRLIIDHGIHRSIAVNIEKSDGTSLVAYSELRGKCYRIGVDGTLKNGKGRVFRSMSHNVATPVAVQVHHLCNGPLQEENPRGCEGSTSS